jgi:hypothetical protein
MTSEAVRSLHFDCDDDEDGIVVLYELVFTALLASG